MSYSIKSYSPEFQNSIEDLILPIQQVEFGFAISREEQPDLIDIPGMFQAGNGNFWVALDGDRVIGTIGVIDINNRQIALKKMFVAEEYRLQGVAQKLMDVANDWCIEKRINSIFLATNDKMLAAQDFYTKNEFFVINKLDLPANFPIAPVATKFYRKDLKG